jgi:hypothetical protein
MMLSRSLVIQVSYKANRFLPSSCCHRRKFLKEQRQGDRIGIVFIALWSAIDTFYFSYEPDILADDVFIIRSLCRRFLSGANYR